MIDLVGPPLAGSAPLLAELWAQAEHRSGVLPLIETFFASPAAFADVAAGRVRGALGLFTPAAEPGWGAAAVAGEPARGSWRLRGDVRLSSPTAGGSIVLARLPESQHRLAWVDHDAPGVERRGSRTGGPVGDGPCWLHLDGTAIAAARVSRPVTLAPDGELVRLLTDYAGVWAEAAAGCARDGARALRRAARTACLKTSQLVALGITEVEIEADLTCAAVRRSGGRTPTSPIPPTGCASLAAAAAAARTLRAVAAKTEELRDSFGLDVEGPFGLSAPGASGAAKSLISFCGGPLLLESELARALGIGEDHG